MSEKKTKKNKSEQIVKTQNELLSIPKCHVTEVSLEFENSISKEQMKTIGEFLWTLHLKGTVQFWIGDWCNFIKDNP